MCPTRLGRLDTRTAIIVGPALLGLILSLATGNEGYIVLIGVYYLEGILLDIFVYPQIFRWQPPWMTFLLACTEFVILLCLASWLDVGLFFWTAVVFFWVSWLIAIFTKVVLLPIFSLAWIENGGEFRRVGWSVAPDYQPLPVLAAVDDRPSEGTLASEFSATHAVPDLKIARPLTSVHQAVPRE